MSYKNVMDIKLDGNYDFDNIVVDIETDIKIVRLTLFKNEKYVKDFHTYYMKEEN